MSDFGAPVAQDVTTPNFTQTLSGLMSLQKTQQDIQAQKLSMQGQASQNVSLAAKAGNDAQDRQEIQAYSQMFKSGKDDQGNDIMQTDANGNKTPNLAVVIPALGRIAPKNAQDLAQHLIQTEKDKVGLQTSAVGLDAANRQNLQGIVQSGVTNSSGDVNASIDQYVQQHPEAASTATFIKSLTPNLDKAPDQQHRQMIVQSLASRLQPGSAVETQAKPGTIDSGGVIRPVLQGPAATGGGVTPAGAPITKTLAPQVVTMPNNTLATVGGAYGAPPGTGGGPAPPAPPPSKLQPLTRPGANAPAADQANYQSRIQAAGQDYDAVSRAATDPMNGVQATRFRNQQILDLIPHANTGPGMRVLNTVASRLPGATGDAYQDLEHYTAQNSAALAKTMGVPGTNLGAETAAAAAGNVERNPGALKEITKTNDALNTAMDLYNRGLAKVTNNGSDMSRAPAYKQAFGQNLDVNAIRWADAHRRGDQEEITALTKKYGPDGIKAFGQKLNTLKSLAGTGDLP